MKITLAFTIFNKEQWIESMLDSWISNLSGQNECEIIIVFDGCIDRSEAIAQAYLEKQPHAYKFLHADDKYEIYCNNLALEHATGDYIIFIQHDNWIYDKNWDLLLSRAIAKFPDVGTIGFLAGLTIPQHESDLSFMIGFWRRILRTIAKSVFGDRQFNWRSLLPVRTTKYERIEVERSHKGEDYQVQNLPPYELGIWQVDGAIRPFCISRQLLLDLGGLETAYMPQEGDDLDLAITLLQGGKGSLYIPYDLLNLSARKETLSTEFNHGTYVRAMRLCYQRHQRYLKQKNASAPKLVMPLQIDDTGELTFANVANINAR